MRSSALISLSRHSGANWSSAGLRPRWVSNKNPACFQNRLLPLPDLHRLHTMLPANLVDGLDPTDGLQPDLGLEHRRVRLALCFNPFVPPCNLKGYSIFGIHFTEQPSVLSREEGMAFNPWFDTCATNGLNVA